MNLAKELVMEEKELLKSIGINIEDREYNNEELRKCEMNIEEFIMSHSSKNGDIGKYVNKYGSILNKIVKE